MQKDENPRVVGITDSGATDAEMREAIRERCKRREIYSLVHDGTTYRFNVSLAWHLVLAYPRQVEEFSPAEQSVDMEHVMERYPDLDLGYASTCDMTLPLLFVPFAGCHQLIDGWHRLARALLEEQEDGCATVAAFILTDAEADVVRMR